MIRLLLRRLAGGLTLLWGVVTLTFLLLELAPGTPADHFLSPDLPPEIYDAVVARWQLDRPWHVRYWHALGNLASGELGWSIARDRPVSEVIAEALPNTLVLGAASLGLSWLVGVGLGVLQAVRRGTTLDLGLGVVSLFLLSVPGFWLALVLVLAFALRLDLLPAAGVTDPVEYRQMGMPPFCLGHHCLDLPSPAQLGDRLRHLVLPTVSLAAAQSAALARYTRSSVLEVLRLDHVRAARAKGLGAGRILVAHVLRNALPTLVTLMGLSLPFLLSGSVVIETVFARPGMGRLVVGAIFARDTPVILAVVYVFAVVVFAGNLLADLANAALDPRVRTS